MNNYENLKQMGFGAFVRALEECGCPPVPCDHVSDTSKEKCIMCWQAWLQRSAYDTYPIVSVSDQSEEQDDHAQDGTKEQEDKNETQQKEQETQTETEGPEQYWYTFGSDDKIMVTDNTAEVNGPSWRFIPIELSGALQAYGVQQTLRGVFGKNMDFAAKSKKYATMVHEAHNYVVATRDAFFAKADMLAWLWVYKADSADWQDALHADCLCAFKEARKWDEILQSETRLNEFIAGFCYGTNGVFETETKPTEEK